MENESKELMVKPESSLFFNVAKFEHAKNVAKIFAESDMVPAHFKGNVGNCLIAINLAERFKADPFMILQNIYVVHGKPGIEGKLVIALVNATGKFTALQYKLEGKKDDATCIAYATRLKTDELCEGPTASIAMAKAEGWHGKQGSKWKTMPGLMLRYRSAAFFARTFCPEALLGMQTKEELYDIVDVTPGPGGAYVMPEQPKTADDLTKEILAESEVAHTKRVREKLENDERTRLVQGDVKHKIEEKNDQAHFDRAFRAEWINLKKGYPQYMLDNLDQFKEASPELQAEALKKWMRLVEKGVIGDIPWPLAEPEEEPEVKTTKTYIGDGKESQVIKTTPLAAPEEEHPEPPTPEEEHIDMNKPMPINSWVAYSYLQNDINFQLFKEAYENLGFEVYKDALMQMGWTAVATSEECRIVAERMSAMADRVAQDRLGESDKF